MKEEFENMDKRSYRIAYLIAGYIRKSLTEAEHDELDAWVEASDDNMLLFEELTDEKNIEANLQWMDKVRTEQGLHTTKQKIDFAAQEKKVRVSRWVYSVAASVIVLIAAFIIYRLIGDQKITSKTIARVSKGDVQPGGNKATLTLSNGKTIDLSDAGNGLIKNDNGAEINKSNDGEIVYINSPNTQTNPALYNILSTPKGGQFKLQLPDGSKVWLNASSSLKYPTSFAATERAVELTGEGYFEVAKNSKQPFRLTLQDQSKVKVLGTHFNVMAYEDEKQKEITLLEGSVEITSNSNIQQIKPGQQAQITSKEIKLLTDVDTEQVTGWKNGEFVFHDADIESILRQVSRWYDVDIKMQATTSQHFNATITRNEPVSRLLHILEETDNVHFKIENKVIYVLP